MKKCLKPMISMVLAIAATLVPLARAQAQAKPAAVISISGLNEVFGDVTALTQWTGTSANVGIFIALARGFTNGLDQTRPVGAYVVMDGDRPQVTAFVPVTNLKAFLDMHKEQIGTPKDVGNGILRLASDRAQPIYVKEQQGWAFVAQEEGQLANLPANPVEALGGLEKKYDIAIRLNVQNIPAQHRDRAVSLIKSSYEQSLNQQSGQLDAQQQEAVRNLGKNSIKSLVEVIQEADQVTIGLAIDAQAKQVFLEGSASAVAGSNLARKMALASDAKSYFTGFLRPDAAMTMNFSQKVASDDIEEMRNVLKMAREQAFKGIDDDNKLPDQKARNAAKDVVGALMDVVKETVENGRIDGGAAVILGEDEFKVVAGGLVSDGSKVEAAFKKLVELGKNQPDFPEVKFNAETHKGVRFHTLSVPLKDADEDAREIFGDELEIVIGTGKTSVFVGIGDDTIDLIKEVIDSSAANGNKSVPSGQFTIALGPILKFAASLHENPQVAALAAASEKAEGKDHIIVTAKPIERGLAYRLEIEEGIFKIIGEVAKAAQGGR